MVRVKDILRSSQHRGDVARISFTPLSGGPKEFKQFPGKVWLKDEVWASSSEQYSHAFFGRDTIETAEDLLPFSTMFARDAILELGALQGVTYNPITEEEPGKIIHEYRVFNPHHPDKTRQIFQDLHKKWGEEGKNHLGYYGSVDATPLYIRLVADYCTTVGNTNILSRKITQKDGKEKTIGDVVWDSLCFLEKRITEGPVSGENATISSEPNPSLRLPLLEYRRMNPEGLDNQNWKDSGTSLLHSDGTLVNHTAPIATIELQGLAFDALTKGTQLFKSDSKKQEEIALMQKTAKDLQDTTLQNFWMPEREYFAVALDRDAQGKYRQLQTIESNAAELLNTSFFDDLPEDKKRLYLGGIVKNIYSPNFLTPVGIRCRGLEHDTLVDFWDYHGTRAVWPKETFDIAKGLAKQGFPTLAQQLLLRVQNSIRAEGSFVELLYIDNEGQPIFNLLREETRTNQSPILTPAIPENWQTWSWSAYTASSKLLHNKRHQESDSWQGMLEKQLVVENPLVTKMSTKKAQRLRRGTHYAAQSEAREKETSFKTTRRQSLQ